MKFQTAIFSLVLLLSFPLSSSASADRHEAVSLRSVKLRVVKKKYDPVRPWLSPQIQVRYASGLYLGKGRILTDLSSLRGLVSATAHFPGDPKSYSLKIEHVGYDCGLLLLSFDLPKKNTNSNQKKEFAKKSKKKKVDAKKNKAPKEGHDDTKPRKLDLKLLRKSNTDIPFIQLEETPKKIEEAKTEAKLQAIRLGPLAFSLAKPKAFHHALLFAYDREGHRVRFKARFSETEFRRIDGSDIDAHWIYPLQRLSQDFQESQSGAPVLFGENLVGILHVSNKKNAYVISAASIQAFLDDIQDGRYDGLQSSGLIFEKIQNPAERRYLGLKEGRGALRVSGFAAGSKSAVFEKGDVLLAVDGLSLDTEGYLSIEGRKWEMEEYLRSRRRLKKEVRVLAVRGGRRLRLSFETVQSPKEHPGRSAWSRPPRYFLGAGVAFVELDYDFVHSPKIRSNARLQDAYQEYILTGYSEGRRSLVLLQRFVDRENSGAEAFHLEILRMINGRRVFGLREFSREWKRSRDSYVVLDFYGRSDKLILPFHEKENINFRVLRRYRLQEGTRVF